MKYIWHFIQYHNAANWIVGGVLLVGASALAASPGVRREVGDSLVGRQESIRSVDNARLLAANFDLFDPGVRITAISEDDEWYYVEYSWKTFVISDSVWQDIDETKVMRISKDQLGAGDLGIFLAEELGEALGFQIRYLKEVQERERENGASRKVASVTYSGLIGRFFNPEERIFEGYDPVIPSPEPPPHDDGPSDPPLNPAAIPSRPLGQAEPIEEPEPTLEELVKRAVDSYLAANGGSQTPPPPPEPPAPSPDPAPIPESELQPEPEPEVTSPPPPQTGEPEPEQIPPLPPAEITPPPVEESSPESTPSPAVEATPPPPPVVESSPPVSEGESE